MTKMESDSEMLTVSLDGKPLPARPGELVIAAAERAGVYIPRFCYHPRMRSVGMCRMCLVEVKGPRGFALAPACFLKVADGMEVITDSTTVRKAQDGVLEFLLLNHPLDCPVCDKGGECPLQDQTMAYGPGETRFLEEKRHWAKPIALGPLVALDRERCIQCDRCTRFASEVAGEPLISFQGRGDHIEVNAFPERPFTSYFSGNTVQICPVGALTAVPYRFRARPWDLEQVESTCTSCAFGCRIALQSSSGQVVRHLGIDMDSVNQGWLCDKGRYGFEGSGSHLRRTAPVVNSEGEMVASGWMDALKMVARRCASSIAATGSNSVAVIGGARLANEDAYAWAKLAKSVFGTASVDAQLGDGLPAELIQGLPRASIDEVCEAKTLLLVGPDLRETLPVLHLRIRSSLLSGETRLVECSPAGTSLTELADASLRYMPGELPALMRRLLADFGEVPMAPSLNEETENRARQSLRDDVGASGDGLVVLLGRPSLAESSSDVEQAASMLLKAFPKIRFLPLLRRANLQGALDAGLAPGLLPGRVSDSAGREHYESAWGTVTRDQGVGTAEILSAASDGEIGVLFLLGADPLSDFPDRSLAQSALEGAGMVVSVETLPNASSPYAHVILPAAAHAERSGSTTNVEGRVSKLGQKRLPPGLAWPDWMIAAELARHMERDLGFESLDDIWDEMGRLSPLHRGLGRRALTDTIGPNGIVLPIKAVAVTLAQRPIAPLDPMAVPGIASVETQGSPTMAGSARPAWQVLPNSRDTQSRFAGHSASTDIGNLPPMISWSGTLLERSAPPRDGYSLRVVASHVLYDAGTSVQASQNLATLAEPGSVRLNPSDMEPLGLANGDSVVLTSARGRLHMLTVADSSVLRGVVHVPFNSKDARIAELIDASSPVTEIRLEIP